MSNLIRDLNHLLAVQEVDDRLERLRAGLAALDDGARIASTYNNSKAEFDRLREAAVKAQAAQQDTELRLKSIEEKNAQVERMLYGGGVSASRELENLQKELDMLGRQKADTEIKVLETMEAAADALNVAQTAETRLVKLAGMYKQARASYREKAAAIHKEVAAAEAERKKAAAPIHPALLARYDAIRARRNGVGAAPLGADNTCGACSTRLNVALLFEARAGGSAQICEYCGRLLVPPLPSV